MVEPSTPIQIAFDFSTIPPGLCQCGCGKRTNVASQAIKRLGMRSGEPFEYLRGHRRRIPIALRFWAKVDKTSSPYGCWIWTGVIRGSGHGHLRSAQAGTVGAHRLSWVLAHGVIPPGLWVLHNCPGGDNPSCVNPDHLWVGTAADNTHDMVAKGRNPHGEQQWCVKLQERHVREIRALYAGGMSPTELASHYPVTRQAIYAVVQRRTWRHVA